MPIYLRNFYLKQLIDIKKEEQVQIDKHSKVSNQANKNMKLR